MKNGNFRLSVRLAAGLLVVFFSFLLMEGVSRLVLAFEDEIRRSPLLSIPLRMGLLIDSYEMAPRRLGYHWVLRPGYSATRQQLVAEKQAVGSVLGARILEKESAKGLVINKDGFRGPEIDKSHSNPRILVLGDSVTFGLGATSYPRTMERRLTEAGTPAEVINGGVEGYAPRNLLYEIERYKKLKPEITVLFIGWNALFTELVPVNFWERNLKSILVTSKALNLIRSIAVGRKEFAVQLYNRKLFADREAAKKIIPESYRPSFMGHLEKVIEGMRAAGSRVVIATLPGLFTVSEPPTARALKLGHLPDFTSNSFVLARMTAIYNQALRDLAKRRGLILIDLEKWSGRALRPRDTFFTDSVHLTAEGLEKIGTEIAEQITETIRSIQ